MWFPSRSSTNPTVQEQKMARCWTFWFYKVHVVALCYWYSENNYCEGDLCLCFRLVANCGFSHDMAHLIIHCEVLFSFVAVKGLVTYSC